MEQNGYGFTGFESNETTIGSLVDDPAKLRLTVHITEHGGGGGVVSFNASRLSGVPILGGNQLEMGYLRVEQSESVRGQIGNLRGEMNIFLNDGSGEDDAAMVRAVAFECDRITKMHPDLARSLAAVLAPYLPGGAQVFTNKLVSPDGRLELDVQNADAPNLALYMDGRAVWSAL